MLLEEAGIDDEWDKVWLEDPKVGTVDEDNLKSVLHRRELSCASTTAPARIDKEQA